MSELPTNAYAYTNTGTDMIIAEPLLPEHHISDLLPNPITT
jgi:hypothetical protein